MSAFDKSSTAEEVATAFQDQIKGKNVLITGVTLGGLGAETARVIVKYASLVILGGRSLEKTQATMAVLKAETPAANLRALTIDLLSWDSVRAAAKEVNAYSEPIHVVINNAVVPPVKSYTTVNGIESQFYGNQLSTFLFTNLILPRVRAAASSTFRPRIIIVSSMGHGLSPLRIDDYNFKDGADYVPMLVYGNTKAHNILYASELARRLAPEGIDVYSLHPGSIMTNGAKSLQPDLIALGLINADGTPNDKISWKTIQEGTATHIAAAFDPSVKDQPGAYWVDCQPHNDMVAPAAADPENATKLWALSEKLIGQTF